MGGMITSEKQDWNCNSCSYYYAGNLYLSAFIEIISRQGRHLEKMFVTVGIFLSIM